MHVWCRDDSKILVKKWFSSEGGPWKVLVPVGIDYNQWEQVNIYTVNIWEEIFIYVNRLQSVGTDYV